MNSTLKILLAFKLKILLIMVSIACTFYIDGKLMQNKADDDTDSHVDNTSSLNIPDADAGESCSPEAGSSLSYYKVAGKGQITNRIHIEIIL